VLQCSVVCVAMCFAVFVAQCCSPLCVIVEGFQPVSEVRCSVLQCVLQCVLHYVLQYVLQYVAVCCA